jgi:hypothetical protein
MCWSKIFKKKPKPPVMVIPHPEEKVNNLQTMDNTSIELVRQSWYNDWNVADTNFWNGVRLYLSLQYSYPAATSSQTTEIWIRPEWANPGVIAHEMAHISYYVLPDESKQKFEEEFHKVVVQDPLLNYLYVTNNYMRVNIIESHADTYRFLGEKMPESLKQYYPHFFKLDNILIVTVVA